MAISNTPETPEKTDDSNPFEALEQSLGMSIQAMVKSPAYANMSLKEIYAQLLPALVTRQFRAVRNKEGDSVAFISWALISAEVEQKIADGGTLGLQDWQSGDIGYVVDVVAKNPQAGNLLVGKLKSDLFPNKPLKATIFQDKKATLTEVPMPEAIAEKSQGTA